MIKDETKLICHLPREPVHVSDNQILRGLTTAVSFGKQTDPLVWRQIVCLRVICITYPLCYLALCGLL